MTLSRRALLFSGLILSACQAEPDPSSNRESALVGPTYLQGAYATPQTAQSSVSVTLPAPQSAGNLLVVLAGWNDTSATISSVTDSLGNTFALAIGPTKRTTALSQSIYYAKNIAGGSNTVTVRFSRAAKFADIRVLEYAGLDTAAPFDSASAANGSSGQADTGLLTTHVAGDLLVAGDMVLTGSPAAGTGYSTRMITNPDSDIAEDRVAGGAGSYNATAPVAGPNAWVIQVVAFKPASGGLLGSGGVGGSGTGGSGTGGSGTGGSGTGGASVGGSGAGGSGIGGSGIGGSGVGGSGIGGSGAGGSGAGGSGIGGSGVGGSGVGGSGVGGSGAGGSGSCASRFPLHTSERLLVDACGVPFSAAGDSPQCLSANLSPANMNAYFSIRAAQGFNASWVNLLCDMYTGGRADATTYDGIPPFTGTVAGGFYDLTKPNPAYFARIDAMVSAAAAQGTVIFLDPIEFGGFWQTISANSEAACTSYGQFLGARYRGQGNIIWMSGNDMAGFNQVNKFVDIAFGIKNAGATQPQTAELDWPALPSTVDDPNWIPANAPISVNVSYSYNPTYAIMLSDYDRNLHQPSIFIEGNYEGENLEAGPHITNAHDCRTHAYWSDLSGAAGWFYGNHWEVFGMDNSTWSANLNKDLGAPQMAYVKSLFEARKWWLLVPDESHVVMTSGLGTCMASSAPQGRSQPNAQDNTCATAARTADGALVIAYMPTARSITVDMSKLAATATARWFDPTSGAFTTVAGSPLANNGVRTFTPPASNHADGYNDWVLVLETSPP
jgi:hypothetical protein